MDRMMIRYRVQPKQLQHNLTLVRGLYDELATTRPSGLRYVTLQLDDELTFVDIAIGPDLPGPLPGLESFRRFRSGIEDRCDERIASPFTEVGSYGWGAP